MQTERTYQTYQIWVKPGHRLFPYFQEMCTKAKSLYNTTNFYIRQVYTAMKRDETLQPTQQEVMDTLHGALEEMNQFRKNGKTPFELPNKEKPMLNYAFMDALFKVLKNENYRSLPTQSSQNIMKVAFQNWKSFFESIKEYQREPGKFKGKPRIPRYCRNQQKDVIFTNQDCVIKEGRFLKFPLVKNRLNIGKLGFNHGKLMQVRVIPSYGQHVVELVFSVEAQTQSVVNEKRIMAIDLGVDNLATIVTNTGKTPTLVKGKVVKSINQCYNKQKAHFYSILRQGKQVDEGEFTSKRLERLHRRRFLKMKDFFHKASKSIVDMALAEGIGTVVIGHNTQWKNEANMGKRNNQSFCHIPHSLLIQMVQYKAKRVGIEVLVHEESYTSKASFLDCDDIPIYGEVESPIFSGKRIHRGLYRSAKGVLLNADVNGAYNILRKAIPNAFANGIEGLDSLMAVAVSTPQVISIR